MNTCSAEYSPGQIDNLRNRVVETLSIISFLVAVKSTQFTVLVGTRRLEDTIHYLHNENEDSKVVHVNRVKWVERYVYI